MEHSLTNLLFGLTGIVLGSLFLAIGVLVSRRHITGRNYLPLLFFSVWWMSIGGIFILQGMLDISNLVWPPDFALHFTYTIIAVPLVCLALYCLTYYFIHIYIGVNRLWMPLAVFYIVSAFTLVYLIILQRPFGLEIEHGRVLLVFANELPFVALRRMNLLLIIPPSMGLIGFLMLTRVVPTAFQKYRLIVVATTIILLFISAIGLPFMTARYENAWRISLRALTIFVSTLLLLLLLPENPTTRRLRDYIDGHNTDRQETQTTARDPERSRT